MVPPWDVGDPIGTGDDIGAPEVPYMSYGPKIKEDEDERRRREEEEERRAKNNELISSANRISDEGWKLFEEGRFMEALVFINRALECCDSIVGIWNRKAIILENMHRYEDALECYDKAMELDLSENVLKFNKARCLSRYANHLNDEGNTALAIEKIDESIEIFQKTDGGEDEDEDKAWNVKGAILERLDDIPGAFNCYKKALELASNDNSRKETYRQNRDRLLLMIDDSEIICPNCGNTLKVTDNFCLKCGKHVEFKKPELKEKRDLRGNGAMKPSIISDSLYIPIDEEGSAWTDEDLIGIGYHNLITVAGCMFYGHEDRLVEGARLRLVKEPDNVYDGDAIAVYSANDKVGYVSNSDDTNSPFSTLASELKWFSREICAEYLCNYDGMYHIARLDRRPCP